MVAGVLVKSMRMPCGFGLISVLGVEDYGCSAKIDVIDALQSSGAHVAPEFDGFRLRQLI